MTIKYSGYISYQLVQGRKQLHAQTTIKYSGHTKEYRSANSSLTDDNKILRSYILPKSAGLLTAPAQTTIKYSSQTTIQYSGWIYYQKLQAGKQLPGWLQWNIQFRYLTRAANSSLADYNEIFRLDIFPIKTGQQTAPTQMTIQKSDLLSNQLYRAAHSSLSNDNKIFRSYQLLQPGVEGKPDSRDPTSPLRLASTSRACVAGPRHQAFQIFLRHSTAIVSQPIN